MKIWNLQHHLWKVLVLQIESEFIQAFKLTSFYKKYSKQRKKINDSTKKQTDKSKWEDNQPG